MCRTVVPGARSPRFQVTVPATFKPPLSAETKLVPAGTGSVAWTLRANEGLDSFPTRRSSDLVPAVTGSGLSDLVIETSAEVATVVASFAELLVVSGSEVVELTEAAFERTAGLLSSTWTVMCRTVVPGARSPRFQVTVPATFKPPLSAETKLVPAGTGSVAWTLWAKEGPAFLTVTVYPCTTLFRSGSGLSDLVIETSAEVATVVASFAELLVVSGSEVVELTE